MTKIASHRVEVFKRHRAFTKTERLFHSRAARFVTHVRAVRQIVRPELAHEQLIKKSGFVAGATGCVEDRFVGRSQRIQFTGDQFERVRPIDRFVMLRCLRAGPSDA